MASYLQFYLFLIRKAPTGWFSSPFQGLIVVLFPSAVKGTAARAILPLTSWQSLLEEKYFKNSKQLVHM